MDSSNDCKRIRVCARVAFLAGCCIFLAAYFMLNHKASRGTAALSAPRTAPRKPKLLWVMVDGLRADFAADPAVMPTLVSLRSKGAWGTARTSGVSLSLMAIKAITTGTSFNARELVANFLGLDTGNDSIFRQARQNGFTTAFSGEPEWTRSFGKYFDAAFVNDEKLHDTAVMDERAHRKVREFLRENRYDITVVHYIHADMTAHLYGVFEGEYARQLRKIDAYLQELLAELPEDATVLVTSDHGLTAWGGHGSNHPEVVQAPFVLAGHGTRNAQNLQIRQIDLAPTLAVLLGVDFPAQSEGRLVQDALVSEPSDLARHELEYATSRLNSLPEELSRDGGLRAELQAARSAFDFGRFPETIARARSLQEQCDLRLRDARLKGLRPYLLLAFAAGVPSTLLLWCVCLSWADGAWTAGSKAPHLALGVALLAGVVLLSVFRERMPVLLRPLPWLFGVQFLRTHWWQVVLLFGGISLPLATPKMSALLRRIPASLWIVLAGLGAALAANVWELNPPFLWAGLAALAVCGTKALLYRRGSLPEVLLYVALLGLALLSGVLGALERRQAPGARAAILAMAVLSLIAVFVVSARVSVAGPREAQADGAMGFLRRRVRSGHWTLLALAAAALAARFFGWTGATPYVLAGVIVNLWWVMRFGPRDSAARMRAFSLAVCAVFPLMYPLRMLPILAVALAALSVTARRLASQPHTHFFSLTLHCLLVMLLLFFLLAGSFELGVVDARRSQFLNPAFDLDYTSVAKIVFLLFLQVLLPLVMVLGWLGCGLQRQRSLWWQMIGLLHLFYLMQLLGLTVSLYFDSVVVNESNSLLYFSLSKMVVVFFVYCGFQAALSVSHQLVWRSRESVDAPAPITEQLAYE